jgi:hypothetical protein
MSSSKEIDPYRGFAAGVYPSEAQEPHTLPPPLTHCICVYSIQYRTYSHREGRGRVIPERRLEGQQFTKLGRNTNMTECISSLFKL